MNFKLLTTTRVDKKIRVNFDLVCNYSKHDNYTELSTTDGYSIYVKETPEEIDKLIELAPKTNNVSDKKYTEDISKEYLDELK